MLHRPQAHVGASGGAHPRQQVWVMDGAMRAIGGTNRSGDVSLHLRSAE